MDLQELQNTLLEMLKDLDSFCKENNIEYSLSGGNVLGAVRHKGFIPWDDDVDVFMKRSDYDKFLQIFSNTDKYFLQKEIVDYPLLFSKIRLNNSTFIEKIKYRKKYKNIHQGIFIDVFPLDKVSTNKFLAKLQTVFSNILIAQSLFIRGYQNLSFKKIVVIFFGILLLPFRKVMINFIKSFNKNENFSFYCSYFSMRRKLYQRKESYDLPLTYLDFENTKLPVMNDYIKYLEDAYGDYMRIPSQEEISYNIHAKLCIVNESYQKYI